MQKRKKLRKGKRSRFLSKHGGTACTILAIVSIGTTVYLMAIDTPKAIKDLEAAEQEKGEPLEFKEKVKAVWKDFIPSGVSAGISIFWVIMADVLNKKEIKALSGLYTVANSALQTYQNKVVETLGKGKEEEIRDAINKDSVSVFSPNDKNVIVTRHGNMLCKDSWSGQYFYSDIEHVRTIINDLNQYILNDHAVSLNDLYANLGLEENDGGIYIGWNSIKKIEVRFGAELTKDGIPCIVMEFINPPFYDYEQF